MVDQQQTAAEYCPHCGTAVEAAETIALEDDPVVQGVFERAGAHLAIDGSLITVYKHGGGDN